MKGFTNKIIVGSVVVLEHESPIREFTYYLGIITGKDRDDFTFQEFGENEKHIFRRGTSGVLVKKLF